MTDTTSPSDGSASSSSILPNGYEVPVWPGTGPHDGERPGWWLFNRDFLNSVSKAGVRGLPGRPDLSDSDIKTLTYALQAIKAARVVIGDPNNPNAKSSVFNLLRTLGYLGGFLTAKGFSTNSSALGSLGRTSIDSAELNGLLDGIERDLQMLVTPTRGAAAGAAAAGMLLPYVGLFGLVGVGLKLYASTLPDEVGG